ncbi:MAG: glycosyltransferase family 2 protein [Dongiaceae bacterium]
MGGQQISRGDCPLVSIGLPVRNGENFLAKAIESALAQTLRNLELVICDNASTDRTQAICEAYVRRDGRVRYIRNPRDLGAGPNYDLAFHRSRGTYFKWLAHDDVMAPAFLEKAISCLRRKPGAVLCYVGIAEIGADDEVLRIHVNHLPGADSHRPSTRFGGMILNSHHCEPFFGLFLREALVGSGLHGSFRGSDRVLLAEMALRGPCVMVPEPLFLHRDHKDRYTRAILLGDSAKAESWLNTSLPASRHGCSMRHLIKYGHYWRLVGKTVRDGSERRACYAQLLRWWFVDYNFRDVVGNLLATVHPRLLVAARGVKRALFGRRSPSPGSLPPLLGGHAYIAPDMAAGGEGAGRRYRAPPGVYAPRPIRRRKL